MDQQLFWFGLFVTGFCCDTCQFSCRLYYFFFLIGPGYTIHLLWSYQCYMVPPCGPLLKTWLKNSATTFVIVTTLKELSLEMPAPQNMREGVLSSTMVHGRNVRRCRQFGSDYATHSNHSKEKSLSTSNPQQPQPQQRKSLSMSPHICMTQPTHCILQSSIARPWSSQCCKQP